MKFVTSFFMMMTATLAPTAVAFAPLPMSTTTTTTTTTTTPTTRRVPLSLQAAAAAAQIEFVKGLVETVVPNVKLTRAKDGSTGVATFYFDNPNVFDASTAAQGEITGMFLIDQEGEMSTTDVNANFSNGQPTSIECTYVMKSPAEWDRFMRFMERYGEANGLGFSKAASS